MLTPNWTWPAICVSLKDLRSEGIGSLASGDLAEPRRSLDDKSILNHWEETMKIRSVVTIVGLAISFGLPTFAQQTNTPDPQLRQKLVEVIAKHADALNKNDAAAAAACFTQEGVYVTDRGPVNGREAIEKWYANLFKKVLFTNHAFTIDQDSPHVIGTAGN
jgi:SnoaL-like domain